MSTPLPGLYYVGDVELNAEKPAEAREVYEDGGLEGVTV
jgi:hypothetical protein